MSGTPSAVPVAPPKLERMSERTTPSWPSTSGPFVPSAGYGPAVSSGISVQSVDAVPDDVVDVLPPVVVDVVVEDAEAVRDEPEPHAASVTAPAAPSRTPRARRRPTRAGWLVSVLVRRARSPARGSVWSSWSLASRTS